MLSLFLFLLTTARQTPNRLNVPHDRALIRVVSGMPHELTLKWELSVCGDHEMTLQYACGAPTFFHPFVHRYVPSPLLASLPCLLVSFSLYFPFFSVFIPPFSPPPLSLSRFSRWLCSPVGWLLLMSAGSLSILSPLIRTTLDLSRSLLSHPLALSLKHTHPHTRAHTLSVFLFLPTSSCPLRLLSLSISHSLWLPGNRDFPSPHRRPT